MTEFNEGQGAVSTEAELERSVRVRTAKERFRTEVAIREHGLVVDEPPSLDGGDTGPTPYELLCAGLGSCTTITVRMYADRKGWPLEEIIARVDHHRDAETGDRFVVALEMIGPLEEAQRGRLLEIAGKCPVHRTLVRGSVVEVRMD